MPDKLFTHEQLKAAIWEELKEADHTGPSNERVYEVLGIIQGAVERIKQDESAGAGGRLIAGTPDEEWENFWKGIVCNADGTINIEQIKKEFADFSFLLEQVPKVYCHITENTLSKVTYLADTVIRISDDYFNKKLEESVKERLNELVDRSGVSIYEHEREALAIGFDKVRRLFEGREWIMEGRGSYPYDDDRYRQEVRFMYEEFNAIFKTAWAEVKSGSAEYRKKIIDEYKRESGKEEAVKTAFDWIRESDILRHGNGHWYKWDNATQKEKFFARDEDELYDIYKQSK